VANLLEEFTARLNSHFFLREYSFAKNCFRVDGKQELELADHVIALPDATLVFQMKERSAEAHSERSSAREWFRQTVVKKGCGQIADSTRFLRDQASLPIPNQRGHEHDLAWRNKPIVPIILYSPGKVFIPEIHSKRHHLSRRAGFVHILPINDYYDLCRTLVLPVELISYFSFREDLLRTSEGIWQEREIIAQFIANTKTRLPTPDMERLIRDALDDIASFDIGDVFRRFGEKAQHSEGLGHGLQYYQILAEFSRLNRSEMRGFKRLFRWALEHAGQSELELPSRMQSLNTRTGFVVFPVPEGAFDLRLNALQNFATLAKYDFRIDRQVGVCVARDGNEIEVDWIFLDFPWQEDHGLEQNLANKNPFRPRPTPKTAYRYPAIER
jgi:hypothetical protein